MMGAAYVSIKGLRMAHDMALLGAQAEMTEASFERMTASVGVSADILDRMKRAAGGTIPELKLMQALNTSLIGVSREFGQMMAEAYPQLVEIARAASIANPALGDTDFMIRSLSIGLKRMSPLIIDNLGLQLRLGDVNKRYAEQLGKTTKELTTEEKQMALLNATLESGARLVDQVGISSANAAIQAQALGAVLADTRVELGKLLGWLLGYQGILTKIVGGIGNYLGEVNEARKVEQDFVEVLWEHHKTGELSRVQYEKLRAAAVAYRLGVEIGVNTTDNMKKSLMELVGGLEIGVEAFKDINPEIERFALLQAAAAGEEEAMLKQLQAFDQQIMRVHEREMKSLTGVYNDWYTQLRYAGGAYAELQNAISYGGWEDYFLQGLEVNRELAAERVKLDQAAAREAAKQWQQQFKGVVRDIEVIMKPTMPEDWWKKALPREDEWDEWARRAASVASEGWASEWLSKLQTKSPAFGKLLEKYGDPKVAAAVWIDNFYKGMYPDAVMMDRIIDKYSDMTITAINRRNLAEEIAKMVSLPEGIEVEPAAIEALLQGDTVQAQALVVGQGAGDALVTSLQEKLTEPAYALQMASALRTQFEEQRDDFKSLGVEIGGAMQEGVLSALTAPDFVSDLARLLAPEVFRQIQEWGWGRCAIQRAQ